jgi:hypothetical protein
MRAMPISASFPLASSRRFATWTSSVISVPFGAHRSPCPRLLGPAPSRSLVIFYRFTVEEAIENGDRAYAALDHTARGGERRGGDAPRRPRRRRADGRIVRHALPGELGLMLRTPGSRPLEAHHAGSASAAKCRNPRQGRVSAEAPTTLAVDEQRQSSRVAICSRIHGEWETLR